MHLLGCNNEGKEIDVSLLLTKQVTIDGSTENGITLNASLIMDSRDVIIEKGFVYSELKNPDIETGTTLLINEDASNNFSIKLTDAIKPDINYYVRSFVKTNKYLIYGNQVSFFSDGSEPPFIEKIEPEQAFWEDTIMITGRNFDHSGKNNKVFFGNYEAQKTWSLVDTIYAVVPPSLNHKHSKLNVSVYGKNSVNDKGFEIYSPVINSISKTDGQFPDTVEVEGDYFNPEYVKLLLSEDSCEVLSADRNKISFRVPLVGKGGNYFVKVNQLEETILTSESFNYHEQIIYEFPSEGLFYGETYVLKAKNVDFRKMEFNILVNGDSYLWNSKIKRYNDSISFELKNPYHKLKKQNTISFRESDFWYQKKDFYSSEFTIKDPELTLLENETVINGALSIESRGMGEDGEFYVEGPFDYSEDFSIDYWGKWQIDFDPMPGRYKFYYSDEIIGKTLIDEFEISQPVISKLSNDTYNRDYDQAVIIKGINLPDKLTGDNSYYSIKHLESGKIVKFTKENSWEETQFSIRSLIGRGEYQIYLTLRGQKIANVITFDFEDEFTYLKKIEDLNIRNQRHTNFCYSDGKLLIEESSASWYMVDLEEKTHVGISGVGISVDYFLDCDNIVYAVSAYSGIFYLKNNEWLELPLSNEEIPVDIIFKKGNELWAILENGNVYRRIQNGFEFYGTINNYVRFDNVYFYENKLYGIKREVIYIHDFATLDYVEEVSGYRFNSSGWLKNLKVGSKIVLYDNSFVFFDLKTETFSNPPNKFLPGIWEVGFFGGNNEDLFLYYKNYIYKYNPQ